ncbi:MAG: pyridoxal-phosphate dependent enzyme [Deltaproteobacteria bacterium]|nr:MAG: pyridoxal-phosphate dependent enzyme [Deltaproteobacteria bacterium]
MRRPASLELHMKPTPIQKLGENLFIKRDDRTGFLLGGNKIRKLEYLLKEAVDKGFKRVMTCGGIQSNHARATAFAARELGLDVALLLRGELTDRRQGNLFLNSLIGADIRTITSEEWVGKEAIMEKWASELGSTYIIPEGGSNALGSWGYVSALEEIQKQGNFDHIFHATGSGGTASGLLAGRAVTGMNCSLHTINVCDDEEYFKKRIFGILDDFERQFDIKVSTENFHIHDGFVGEGYALASDQLYEQIKSFCGDTGILLDPVYTGKAFFGMQEVIKRENLEGKILFLHTGGAFANFANVERYRF